MHFMQTMMSKFPLAITVVLFIYGCHSAKPDSRTLQPQTPQPLTKNQLTSIERLAAIDRLSAPNATELSVQPLRENAIIDLLERAQAQRAAGDLNGAQSALEQALQIAPKDPLALQARAEIALLQEDWVNTEVFAHAALANGSHDGPLCRRHWATIEQASLAMGRSSNAESARHQIDACRVSRRDEGR